MRHTIISELAKKRSYLDELDARRAETAEQEPATAANQLVWQILAYGAPGKNPGTVANLRNY